MAKIKFDLTEITGLQYMEPGLHTVEITEVKVQKSSNKKPQVVVTFTNENLASITEYMNLTGKGAFKFKALLEALDLLEDNEGVGSIDTDDLLNEELVIEVVKDKNAPVIDKETGEEKEDSQGNPIYYSAVTAFYSTDYLEDAEDYEEEKEEESPKKKKNSKKKPQPVEDEEEDFEDEEEDFEDEEEDFEDEEEDFEDDDDDLEMDEDEDEDESDYGSMTVVELRKLAAKAGIPHAKKKKKATLINLLEAMDEDDEEEEEEEEVKKPTKSKAKTSKKKPKPEPEEDEEEDEEIDIDFEDFDEDELDEALV